MNRLLILIAICLWASLTFGQTPPLESAKALQKTCATGLKVFEQGGAASTEDAVEFGKCIGYVEGVLDSMRVLRQKGEDGKSASFHMHGDGFVLKNAVVFFLDFMQTDKESDHNGPAAPVIIQALMRNHLVTTSEVSGHQKQ